MLTNKPKEEQVSDVDLFEEQTDRVLCSSVNFLILALSYTKEYRNHTII